MAQEGVKDAKKAKDRTREPEGLRGGAPRPEGPPDAPGAPAYRPLPRVEGFPGLSLLERRARGRAARSHAPLSAHAAWAPPPGRPGAVALLEDQSRMREPDLVPIRYGRMAASAFAFYRGSATIMASDLSGTPTGGLRAQLCGDAHLMNFGVFRTPERALIFDVNDFDETLPGPWEWDVKRLIVSFEVAGRDLALGASERRTLALRAGAAYRRAMAEFAEQSNLEVWYARFDADRYLADVRARKSPDRKPVEKIARKALRKDHLGAFDNLCERRDGRLCLKAEPPLLVPVAALLDEEERLRYVTVMREFLAKYRESLPPERRVLIDNYRYVDMARKVVGVGSVGTRCWVVLLTGRDEADPLFIQLKWAGRSVLEPYAGASAYRQCGRRVVEGQRLMQAASDPLLGWYRLRALDGRRHNFYARQLWDGKASVDLSTLSTEGLGRYAEVCGWTLARGHAVSGDRVAMAAYLGGDDEFDEALAAFAIAYADTNEEDHAALQLAIEQGRVHAVDG